MQTTRQDLDAAVARGIIGAASAEALLQFFEQRRAEAGRPRFDATHVLWYAGALIVMAAMGLFSTNAFSRFGGRALTLTAVAYGVVFAAAGHFLWHRRNLRLPGGLLVTVAVTMAPLAVYGIQDALGWWSQGAPGAYRDFFVWIKGSWLFMDAAAIVAGALALRFYRFPFLTMPIAVALWFMSMDLTPWIFGVDWHSGDLAWEKREIVSLWFGLGVLVVAWWVDIRSRGDFAFWLHLFGLMSFWGGMSMLNSNSELSKAIYCLINVGLLALSLFLHRRAYMVFGTLGVAGYLEHLAGEVFKDSLL
ncbi:MAG TPA: hypothetical protein VFK49_06760, partial [Stellaceae bacterium]|nr:hypothetical protein [Stellaceae bacterium]